MSLKTSLKSVFAVQLEVRSRLMVRQVRRLARQIWFEYTEERRLERLAISHFC